MLKRFGEWLGVLIPVGALLWALAGRITALETKQQSADKQASDLVMQQNAFMTAQAQASAHAMAEQQRIKGVEDRVDEVKRVVLEQQSEQREMGKEVVSIRENVAGLRALLQQQERDRRASN